MRIAALLVCALLLAGAAAFAQPSTNTDEVLAMEAARKATGKIQSPTSPNDPALPPGFIPCQRLEKLLKIIVGQRRLGYFADAVDNTGIVHMWFMSRERREWVTLTVDHDLTACIISEGSEWRFALEPAKAE